jgi:hypothetical protein
MDLKIINLIFKFGKILSLTPSSTKKMRNLNGFEKLHGCLMFATLTFFICYSLCWTEVLKICLSRTQCILAVAIIFTYISHSLYVLVVVNLQKHCKWFKLLASLKNTQCYKNNQNLYCLQFVMSHLITLSVIVVDVYFYCIYYDTPLALFNLIFCIEMYLQLFYLVLRCIILEMLLSRYHHQNNVLQRATVQNILKISKKTKHDLLTLKNAIKTFNDIFGWASLLDILSASLGTLIHLDFLVRNEIHLDFLAALFGIAILLLCWVPDRTTSSVCY